MVRVWHSQQRDIWQSDSELRLVHARTASTNGAATAFARSEPIVFYFFRMVVLVGVSVFFGA